MPSPRRIVVIVCRIDTRLLARVASTRARTGKGRSAFIQRALSLLIRRGDRARAAQRYVDAYRERPESAKDVRRARRIARRALSLESLTIG